MVSGGDDPYDMYPILTKDYIERRRTVEDVEVDDETEEVCHDRQFKGSQGLD